jgi:hypothetical protein
MTRLIRHVAMSFLAAASSLPAAAQSMTVLQAGRLVDVERGEVRRDQLVVIRDGRIQSVQPGSGRPPQGARIIDLSGFTVVPGRMSVFAAWVLLPPPSSSSSPQPANTRAPTRIAAIAPHRCTDRISGASFPSAK